MPPLLDPNNIYAANRAGNLSPTVERFPARVYVPNTDSNSVDVIDPVSLKVVEHSRSAASRSTSRRRTTFGTVGPERSR